MLKELRSRNFQSETPSNVTRSIASFTTSKPTRERKVQILSSFFQ